MAKLTTGIEPPNTEKLSNDEQVCYDEVIKKKIHHVFDHYVNPPNVLHVFWKYDTNVLVEYDIQLVQAVTDSKGMIAGARKLLDLLYKYHNWFPCLIQVLKDKEVRLTHVAEKMLQAVEQVQSDKNVDAEVKVLAEKDALIERLKTELDEAREILAKERNANAAKEKELTEEKSLLEKDIKDLKMEIQKLKGQLEKEMLQQKVLLEKDKKDINMLNQALKIEQAELQTKLTRTLEEHFIYEKQMLETKDMLEKEKDEQGKLIQELEAELEKVKKDSEKEKIRFVLKALLMMTIQKILAEKDKQNQKTMIQKLKTEHETLTSILLKDATDISMMKSLMWTFAQCGQYKALSELTERGVDINQADANGKTALMFAAGVGNLECVKWLISKGADIEAMDEAGQTALSHAANHGSAGCVLALLEAGSIPHVNIPNSEGQTPLMLAAGSVGDNVHCVEKLLVAGAETDLKDKKSRTPLACAAERGNVKCLQILLETDGRKHVNTPNNDKQTPLMLAAKSEGDNVQCLQKLLKAGANLHIKDCLGNSVLSCAAESGNVKCIQTILNAGGQKYISISNAYDETPLMLAARSKGDNIHSLQALLNAGANPDKKNSIGYTALTYAVESGNVYCVQKLLEDNGYEHINSLNNCDRTPLMLAASSKGDNFKCVYELLKAGADSYLKNNYGFTALAYAAESGNVNCLQMLLDNGDKYIISTPDAHGQTPLILAAKSKEDNVQCLQKLVDSGADISLKDKFGHTALDYAKKGQNVKCIQALLKAAGKKHINVPNKNAVIPVHSGTTGENFTRLSQKSLTILQ